MSAVETTLGPVVGRRDGDIHAFRGIPYAAPPIGERRFAHPEPHRPWTEPRSAIAHGAAAPQVANALAGLVPGMEVDRIDEDCLTLNVWTPDPSGDRPLLVWLHGGGFSLGNSGQANYDGARLARRGDVVVASANYRLGALGYLVADGVDANCGLADQIAALGWLRANAAAFGADPERITVFGESAGGGSVLSLLAAPSATGLMRRAIVQSGASNQFLRLDAAREVGEAFLAAAGVRAGDRAALRALDLDAILSAQSEAALAVMGSVGIMPWHPTDDTTLLPVDWFDAFAAGAASDVDLVIGTTRDEMNLFASFDPAAAELDDEALSKRLTRLHPDPDAVVRAYRSVDPTLSPPDVWARATTHTSMWAPALRILDARTSAAGATFAYRFDWPAADPTIGACHGIDIPFAFDTIDVAGWDDYVADPAGARALSHVVQDAWSAFARTGDPSSASLTWPRYVPPQRSTMVLGPVCEVVDDPDAAIRRIWTT